MSRAHCTLSGQRREERRRLAQGTKERLVPQETWFECLLYPRRVVWPHDSEFKHLSLSLPLCRRGLLIEPPSRAVCCVQMEWLFVRCSESYKRCWKGKVWTRGERRVWEAEAGAGQKEAPPGHSPRAQKTPTLLESENGTFMTSLWLSKSLSGPSQVSTIGDMSFRSEESGTLETTLHLPP